MSGGKGFGGGEATRDPAPTLVDPNDPKGKQQAIHKAESFADYLARRQTEGAPAAVPTAPTVAAPAVAVAPVAAPAAVWKPTHYGGFAPGAHDYIGNAPCQGSAPALVNYGAVRRELRLLMDNPSWDDGSLAPIFIRLAWHSSGTYDKESGTGGSNGAGMRFATEAADPENAGLAAARAFLEPIKRRFPGISYSDLWVLAAYVGIEHTGGPAIPFTPGRTDHPRRVVLERDVLRPAARR